MPKPRRYTVDQIARALRKTAGITSAAAQSLKCDPETVRRYIQRYPQLREVLEEIVERNIDLAESKLLQAMARDVDWAVKFYLETKGKHRGYSRRVEATMTANVNVNITVTDARRAFYDELDAMVARRRSVLGGRVIGNEPLGAGPVSEETQH